MIYMGKEIDKFTDEQLTSANRTLDQMLENYNKKLESNPKKVEKYSISPNPKFEDIQAAIKAEMKKRNLWI